MIPIYGVDNLTGNLDVVFQNIMRILFITSFIATTFWIIASLLVWLFGAKKKSEKAIKFGIKNFVVSVVLMIIILLMPMLLENVKV